MNVSELKIRIKKDISKYNRDLSGGGLTQVQKDYLGRCIDAGNEGLKMLDNGASVHVVWKYLMNPKSYN